MTEVLLNILAEFGGGRGAPDNTVVRFLLPAFFWTLLAGAASFQLKKTGERRDVYILAASLFGLTRELTMFAAEYGSHIGLWPYPDVFQYYPPFEHALTMLSGVFIGYAFIQYFFRVPRFANAYLAAGSGAIIVLYIIITPTWITFLHQNPDTLFGAFWGDMVFRVTASILMGTVLLVFARNAKAGNSVPLFLWVGFAFLFLDEFLMIFNLATDEIHVAVYAPIRHNLHIWAIPFFGAVYWQDMRRQSEESSRKTEAVIAALGDGLSIHDRNFKVTYQNPQHRKIMGDVIGRFCYEAYHGKSEVCEDCEMAPMFRDGKVHMHNTYYSRKDMHAEVTVSPLSDEDGQIVAGIELIRDTTEHKRLEEQYLHSQRLEAVGRLAGGIAHDFNNLLTAIIMQCDNLATNPEFSDRTRKSLERMLNSCDRAAQLTGKLLAVSRKQVLDPLVIDLNRILTDMKSTLLSIIGEDVEIQLFLDPVLSSLKADPVQVEQIILNLATNARDAMPSGGKLVLKTSNRFAGEAGGNKDAEAHRDYVVLEVSDTGAGIEEAAKEHLFEPFFTTKGEGKGTGLGLATVYGIAKQSGGFVEVESSKGKGSTFRVLLPASSEKPGGREARQPISIPCGEGTILLVEDDTEVRSAMEETLSTSGYKVLAARHPREALRLVEDGLEDIQLLLTDVVMPGMNGRELADILKSRKPDLFVIFMSGYTDDILGHHGILPTEMTLVKKPFHKEEILAKVQEVITAAREKRAGP